MNHDVMIKKLKKAMPILIPQKCWRSFNNWENAL